MTSLKTLLGLALPIIQAPMAGVQGSAHLLGMAEAHGLMLVGGECTEVHGEVSVQVFDPSWATAPSPAYRWA